MICEGTVWCVNVGSDKTLYSGSGDNTVRIWKDGKCLQTIEAHAKLVWSLFIGDSFFITGSDDTTAKVWDKSKGKCLRVLKVLFVSVCCDVDLKKKGTFRFGDKHFCYVWTKRKFGVHK